MSAQPLLYPALVAGIFLLVSAWCLPESRLARAVLVLGASLLYVRYAIWRWTDTLPLFDGSPACLALYGFFGIELVSLLLFLRSRRSLISTSTRCKIADRDARWHERLAEPPLVDVFIPTYNETWDVLEKTFVGLSVLDYSRTRVWILDDGRRDWLTQRAAEFGFHYLRRSDNAHYKAGNLNHGLAHVFSLAERPDFIAVFDADFVPQPGFIERTLALMADEQVGLVQTPQSFYNPDPFQYGFLAERYWPDEQRFLFDVRMPSVDDQGGAQCCGTSFLIRARALDAIGERFPTDSICEDTLTSMKLRRAGWRTVYLAERLSVGLNPEGLGEFLKQRSRWCLGGVQIAQWSLRVARGPSQTFAALEAMLKWGYMSFVQILWLGLPILFWFTGFSLLHARAPEIVAFMVPMWLTRSYVAWITRGTQMPIVTDCMTLTIAPTVVRATISALRSGRQHAFRVTSKGISRTGVVVYWPTALFAGTALALILGGMVYRTWVSPLLDVSGYSLWFYWASIQWSVMLLAVTLVAIERPRRRTNERYPLDEPVGIEGTGVAFRARTTDISLDGIALSCPAVLRPGHRLSIDIASVGRVNGVVVRARGELQYGIRFEATPAQRRALIRRIYCSGLAFSRGQWRALPCVVAIFRRLWELVWSSRRVWFGGLPAQLSTGRN